MLCGTKQDNLSARDVKNEIEAVDCECGGRDMTLAD